MKFRRNWKIIYLDVYALNSILFFFLLFVLYIPLKKNNNYSGLLLVLSLNFIFLLMCFFVSYLTGELTDYVFLTDNAIVLHQKKNFLWGDVKEKTEIRWADISKIIRARYAGGKSFIIWDKYGHKIWFNYSKKIENYIHAHHPELTPLFPAENDIHKKWKNWNQEQ